MTENGFSNSAIQDDTQRLNGIKSYLKALLTAIYEDGCNVQSYSVWSLLDNFEWDRGYRLVVFFQGNITPNLIPSHANMMPLF